MEDVEREGDDVIAVLLGEVGDRSDEARARLPQLGAALDRRVLTHDRAAFTAAGFLKGAKRAERARIVDRADENAPRLARAEMATHGFEAVAEHAVAVDRRHATLVERRTRLFHADQHAGEAHLRQAASPLQREEQDLVNGSVPVMLGPASEVATADQT